MEELLRLPPVIDPPVMNAAGSLGFAPDLRLPLPWEMFGAFVTNPISLWARKPASGPRWRTFPGGGLLHTGHFNPGFRAAIRQYAAQWAASPLPVIVHLLADHPAEIGRRIEELETLENILAVEVGFPEGISADEVRAVLASAVGEKPILARVSLNQAESLGPVCCQAGAVAVTLGPGRGAVPEHGQILSGRMVGPAVFPHALQVVRRMAQLGVSVIGAGGVYSRQQIDAMLGEGALAVQLDLSLWRGDWFKLAGAQV